MPEYLVLFDSVVSFKANNWKGQAVLIWTLAYATANNTSVENLVIK